MDRGLPGDPSLGVSHMPAGTISHLAAAHFYFAFPLLAIGIWDSFEEGFVAFAACVCALVLVSAASYVSFLVLSAILDWQGHPPADC